ncbi:hypothetical protein CKO12_04775 [Chromatium okenii]|nr:hypothetical protein [Chromatium okenii]
MKILQRINNQIGLFGCRQNSGGLIISVLLTFAANQCCLLTDMSHSRQLKGLSCQENCSRLTIGFVVIIANMPVILIAQF